jgi:hypothetical protein
MSATLTNGTCTLNYAFAGTHSNGVINFGGAQ